MVSPCTAAAVASPFNTYRAETLLIGLPWWDLCGSCAEAENGPEGPTSPTVFLKRLPIIPWQDSKDGLGSVPQTGRSRSIRGMDGSRPEDY